MKKLNDTEEKYFADDRIIIPDYIKNMTAEELDREIERLEREAREEKRMNSTLIKRVPATDGSLYAIYEGKKELLAKFDGYINIYERQTFIPILGRLEKGTKYIYASFEVSGDVEYVTQIDEKYINNAKLYEARAIINNKRILLAGLIFTDSDSVENTLTFEIRDMELIRQLMSDKR